MKIKFLSLVFVISLIGGSFLFTGCGEDSPTNDSSLLLQQSIHSLFGSSSLRYNASIIADMKSSTDGGDVSLDIQLTGAVSTLDKAKAGSEFTAVMKAKDSKAGDYRIDVTMKSIKEMYYLKLLSLPTIPDFPVDGLAKLVGTWWKIDAKQLNDVSVGSRGVDDFGTDYAKLDAVGKKKRDLILTSTFFKNIEFDKTEDNGGKLAYKYNVVLNSDGIIAYLKSVAELDGQKNVDTSDVKKFFDDVNFSGTLWIDVTSKTLTKVSLKANPSANSTEWKKLELAMSVTELNQPFNVESPTDSKTFDLGTFLASFLPQKTK